MSSTNSSLSPETLLDTLLPGFSLLSRLVSLYHYIDLSLYSFYIVSIAIFWAFVTFLLPKLFDKFQNWVLRYAASTEIMCQDRLYGQVMQEDEEDQEDRDKYQLEQEKQSGTNQTTQGFWQHFRFLNKMRIICYTPKKKELHLFWYRNRICALRRQASSKGTNSPWAAVVENITIYTAPWNQQLLRELISEVQRESLQQESNHITVYRGVKEGSYQWIPTQSNIRRSLANTVLDQKHLFLKDVEKFLKPSTREWYTMRDIPYRRGYLFHGAPGTGKSSLCLGTASLFGLDVYILSLNSLDENGLALLFRQLPKRCVILFEDIDTAGLQNRRNNMNTTQIENGKDRDLSQDDDKTHTKQGSITLASLLNELDGVGAQEGRVLVMTTNHRGKLDAALIRPGRVDMKVEFKLASTSVVQELFRVFYEPKRNERIDDFPGTGDKDQSSVNISNATNEISALSAEFALHVPGGKLTHAEIHNYLLRHRKDPISAVAGANEWIQNTNHSANILPTMVDDRLMDQNLINAFGFMRLD